MAEAITLFICIRESPRRVLVIFFWQREEEDGTGTEGILGGLLSP